MDNKPRPVPTTERMKSLTYLDLGGTACRCSRRSLSISRDGTTSGDDICYNYAGDYSRMPEIPSNHFSEALGACFLETSDDSDSDSDDDSVNDFRAAYREVYRVLRPGAKLIVKGCGRPHINHLNHALEAGFEVIDLPSTYIADDSDGGPSYDSPWIFRKGE